MGDTLGDRPAELDPTLEIPVHAVLVSPFYLDIHEVTKGLWDEIKNWSSSLGYGFDEPGIGAGPKHPVLGLSWYNAVKWCNARSQKAGLVPAYYTDAALTQIYQIRASGSLRQMDRGV